MHKALCPTLFPILTYMIMHSSVASTEEIGAGRSAEQDSLSYIAGIYKRLSPNVKGGINSCYLTYYNEILAGYS